MDTGKNTTANTYPTLQWSKSMTREEFYKWLNTCPAVHRWEADELGFVVISFEIEEEEETTDE